ncbi:MAG: ABC transporter substrate-binding protein [Mesorhizobium sp.]|uniref:ABC transporter substrate-binding protein n=1 Tax=Mesorhizobium sp. TaxID=1871066 RepID=UPI000FE9E2CD|nr:ABC transporter substrate-binding protein [Mesorhizobium sp.]RWH31398.1 MAG: ABC transporter substrate-binding protein [Mesorhizobium sp.]RWH38640.1 MAG: ABC transporter substrate-binding protein [Mesorhizobium sp.]TIM71017.1 MAG: ABC transporter substrate-binding protein [Mesorhizobium sp.]TIO05223.1 MAG: ABC transporter substrate-binding protein [Mesorhizobium sp.]TIR61880.1 MAG: ABC transporter substrate-binding protein [Mesorhizobium sp.]
MTFQMNRRRFMQTTSSAIAAGALPTVSGRALAASSNELRVSVYGGQIGDAIVETLLKPFEAETGIKMIPITQDFTLAQLELMVKAKNVTVDVAGMEQTLTLTAKEKGLLEEIDYSLYKKEELDGFLDFAKDKYGAGQLIYSFNMIYNTKKYPAGKPRPANWAEFWDVEKFPGVRYLVAGLYGTEGPWEEALMADGVAPDKIYPMDIDRIFASLDKIKPHIRKWWSSGSEIQQLMQSGGGDVMESYDGRALAAIDAGAPLEINRNQAKMTWAHWVIPKGCPNSENAQKFIEFATRGDRQATFVKLYPEGPTNRNAFKHIPADLARKLPTYPEYMANSIPLNGGWYVEVGSDGRTNVERLIQRWNQWILQ